MSQTLQRLDRQRGPRYREAVYDALKTAVLDGQIEAGAPLTEERIAAELGISRTPVREALAILEHEGVIAPRNGRGLYIREHTRDEFLDLFVANEAVEPFLARNAAVVATGELLEPIQDAIERGRDAATTLDLYAFLRSGRDFHRALGLAAGNASLSAFVSRNEEQADLYLLSLGNRYLFDHTHMTASNREHAQILDAIHQRDPEAAARLVIYHAQSLRARYAPLFQSQSPEEAREPAATG